MARPSNFYKKRGHMHKTHFPYLWITHSYYQNFLFHQSTRWWRVGHHIFFEVLFSLPFILIFINYWYVVLFFQLWINYRSIYQYVFRIIIKTIILHYLEKICMCVYVCMYANRFFTFEFITFSVLFRCFINFTRNFETSISVPHIHFLFINSIAIFFNLWRWHWLSFKCTAL